MRVSNSHRQAITTKYLGPTNSRGSRVKASAQAGSITVEWDDALNPPDNHAAAALAFAQKYDWDKHAKRMIGGALPDGSGYAFVLE